MDQFESVFLVKGNHNIFKFEKLVFKIWANKLPKAHFPQILYPRPNIKWSQWTYCPYRSL